MTKHIEELSSLGHTTKTKYYKLALFFFELGLVIAFILLISCGIRYALKFLPINGDFQNYNPVQRLLDGQVLCRDFWDYLGFGHALLGSVATKLFGGTFAASEVAFKFLTVFTTFLFLFVLADHIFSDHLLSLGISGILFGIIACVVTLGFNVPIISDYFRTGFNAGTSARFLRAMVLPLMILLFRFCIYEYDRLAGKWRWMSSTAYQIIGIGVIAGVAFCWSNDYGVSCYVCVLVMVFWVSLSRHRKILSAFLKSILTAAVGLLTAFLVITLISHGNFSRWLKYMVGAGAFQNWYYISYKSLYLYNIDLSKLVLLQGVLAFTYMIIVFAGRGKRKILLRYGTIGFANMVGFCAANEYKLLSGGFRNEVSCVILIVTIIYEALYWLIKLISLKRNIHTCRWVSISCVLIYVCILPLYGIHVAGDIEYNKKTVPYMEQLGGNITAYASDLQKASEFLQGKRFFSTYASAQEVIEGFIKPSATDYIIHVLGDEVREQYLQEYRDCEYPYSMIINLDGDEMFYEYWVEYANWFFYRELYEHEHPVFYNSYAVYWEDNEPEKNSVYTGPIEVEILEENQLKKLVVKTDPSVSGRADVFLDYSVEKIPDKFSPLLFRKMLHIFEPKDASAPRLYYKETFLRDKSAEYISVKVNDGYGELFLEAMPKKDCILNIHTAKCDRILTTPSQYFKCSDMKIEDGRIQFYSENAYEWPISLSQRSTLCFRGIEYPIKDISQDNNRWIITVSCSPDQIPTDNLTTMENIFCIK